MTWTKHGHQIEGSPLLMDRPAFRARCGGPGLCVECSHDQAAYWAIHKAARPASMMAAHARNELKGIGEESDVIEAYIRTIEAFSELDHSGRIPSATAIEVLYKLLKFESLQPDDKSEPSEPSLF